MSECPSCGMRDDDWFLCRRDNCATKTKALDPHAEIETLRAELEAVKAEVYVPGEFRCPKCQFTLSQFRMNAVDGSIGDRDEPGEKCPNDGSPLWRVTWKDRAHEHYERAVEEIHRARAAEARADKAAEDTTAKLVIEVEKLLLAKLGREWTPDGISIRSLIDELALRGDKK